MSDCILTDDGSKDERIILKATIDLIAELMREIRTDAGITQGQLAERADVVASTVTSVEGGSRIPSVMSLIKISSALGVEMEEILPTHATIKARAKSLGADLGKVIPIREETPKERALALALRLRRAGTTMSAAQFAELVRVNAADVRDLLGSLAAIVIEDKSERHWSGCSRVKGSELC